MRFPRHLTAALLIGAMLPSCSDKQDADESISRQQVLDALGAVAYDHGGEVLDQQGAISISNPNSALVIARTQYTLEEKAPLALQKLGQAYIAKSTSSIRKVTPEDLTGTSVEGLIGTRIKGGVQDLAANQQAKQFALSQGLPAVLTVSIESYQVRETSTVAGVFLGDVRGTVSLVSCIEGTRLHSADARVTVRGMDFYNVRDEAIDKLAEALAAKSNGWTLPEFADSGLASCEVHARIEGLVMPSFTDNSGTFSFTNQGVPLYAPGAAVEIDGVLVGQTPCRVTVGKGMHQLKVSRPGLDPFVATVNLAGQNRYDAILVPSAETLAKYNEQVAYLRDLQQQEDLNQAEIDVMNGYADLLRQSGFRIDIRDIDDPDEITAKDK